MSKRWLDNIQQSIAAFRTVLESAREMTRAVEEFLLQVALLLMAVATLSAVVGHDLSPVIRDAVAFISRLCGRS